MAAPSRPLITAETGAIHSCCKKSAAVRSKDKGVIPMSARTYLAVLGIAAVAFVLRPDAPAVIEAGPAPIENAPIVDGGDQTTTLDDQAELSITVYNSDIALIRDVRNLQLPRGTGNLRFMDIAATINPTTVHFRSELGR